MKSSFSFRKSWGMILICMTLLLYQGVLIAGITGKIAGKIVDADTREPLPGVNIVIEGTTMGASTDLDGDYYIINIPPGTYNLVASMMGYATQTQTDILVSVDRTITINFNLSETAVIGEEVTIVAERDIIPMDVSASRINATAEEMTGVPFIQDINEFLNLQAGIEDNLIRGGGLDATEFMMDGLTVVDNRTNQPLMMVNLSAVEEVNIIKGGFNAEYGNVRSGLINVITKEGGQDYSGSVDFRYSPARYKHEGYNIFDPRNWYLRPYLDPAVCWDGTDSGGWTEEEQNENLDFGGWEAAALGTNFTAEELRDIFIWQHRSEAYDAWNVPGADDLPAKYGSSLANYETATGRSGHENPYGDKPDWNLDVSLGGPVPFVGKYLGDLSFFGSYRINKELYRFPTARDYFKQQSTQLKLTSRISSTMKLALEGLYGTVSDVQGPRVAGIPFEGSTGSANNYFEVSSYWPAGKALWDQKSSMIGLSFDHVLSPSTFYNVRISMLKSEIESDGWESHALRDTTSLFTIGTRGIDETPYAYAIPLLSFEDGLRIGGEGSENKDHSSVNTLNIKFDLTTQIDKYNQVKTGFEFNYDDLNTNEEFDVPVQPDRYSSTVWSHFPYRLGAYVQDKIEFKGMIANVGLRLDYNNPNCDWYTVDPFSNYFKAEYAQVFQSDAPKEKAENQVRLSPRLGVSHPISENAKLYFNYGHFYSMPTSNDMYRIGYGRPGAVGVTGIGNPSADLEKTVAYELGVEYDIGNMFLLHAAGYYRDITDQTAQITYQNYNETIDYSTFRNKNYEDIRGFELRLEKRWGEWVTGWINYDYMVTCSGDTGRTIYYDDPYENLKAELSDPDANRPLSRPSMRANVTVRTPNDLGPTLGSIHPLGDISVNVLVTWRAGEYITWDPLTLLTLENNLQWKGHRYIDLRINKRLRVGLINFEIFADINNLLNSKYINSGAFRNDEDREDYYRSLHLPMYEGEGYKAEGLIAGDDKLGDVKSDDKPYIDMPDRDFLTFINPRFVTLGLRVNF